MRISDTHQANGWLDAGRVGAYSPRGARSRVSSGLTGLR